MEKRNYELMLILSGTLTDEKRGELITKFQKMASDKTAVEKWGMRRFAYPIQYRNEGFYVLMHFVANADKVAEMTKLFNITDGVVRYLFIVKDEKQIAADAARKAMKRERIAREGATEDAPKPVRAPRTPKEEEAKA